jgi:hypothetical protein
MVQRAIAAVLFFTLLAVPVATQPKKRRILAIGDVHRKNYQHDAVSHALATIEQMGRKSDRWGQARRLLSLS